MALTGFTRGRCCSATQAFAAYLGSLILTLYRVYGDGGSARGLGVVHSEAKLRVRNAFLNLFKHLVAELAQRLSHVLHLLLHNFCFANKECWLGHWGGDCYLRLRRGANSWRAVSEVSSNQLFMKMPLSGWREKFSATLSTMMVLWRGRPILDKSLTKTIPVGLACCL